ncbi:hypothetical protein VPNG_02688 [Cytospora leucostoma]|uniref:Pre-mRNA-splicing factor 38B n=1 Tax=Cytospora leucostoma TaxID=1230097 RepID=A0A423XJ38_9PEZI|nr:hypothetical protein VPNG_02688 [Cytospora leucostoma]
MGDKGLLTDEYVADVLAKEAKDCSLKYSTMGLEAYTSTPSSTSRPANKAKPNTRFLRNIIKGTEHHNKTLLAKEQAESQARLREHANAEEEKRRKYRPSAGEIRGRQLGNIAALLQGQQGQKRKRSTTEDGDGTTDLQKARAAEDARRLADMAAARRRQRDKDGKRKRSMERYSARRDTDGNAREERARRYNTSSDDEDRGVEHRKRRHRSRSPKSSPRKHRHRSPIRDKNSKDTEDRSERGHHRKSEAAGRSSRHARDEEEEADSYAADDLIGPAPPPSKVLPRGRGALRGSSGIDSRFSSEYDPKSDMQLDDEGGHDDWDEALEALRDRAKFKQQGADRLRQAGFTEEQVKKWEKGDEKTIDDVKWTKAGEKREWDRGKDVGQEDSD